MRRFLPLAVAILCASRAAAADEQRAAPTSNELPTFEKPAERKPPPKISLLVGLRGGPVLAGGDLVGNARTDFGGSVGLDVGARFLGPFYGGLTFDGVMFSTVDALSRAPASVTGFGFAAMGGWFSHPEKVGLFTQLGLGTHIMAISTQTGRGDTHGSVELRVMAGLSFRVTNIRIVVPRVDLAAGGADGLGHALFTFGLSAAYEHEFGKRASSD